MTESFKNIYDIKITLYDWQKKIKDHINDNICIIAPTGAGKTISAYQWAFDDIEKYDKVIFTAPIKALSNERYFELKKMFGSSAVGVLTGDVRINPKAKILCMTQEIYTNNFALIPHQKVIIDEIHYMFQDQNRSRSYIDGINKTSNESKLMLLSATVNKSIVDYFSKVANRNFVSIFVEDRPIPLYFKDHISYKNIFEMSPAIVFVFSMKGVENIANELYLHSKFELKNEELEELKYYSDKYKISNDILKLAKKGIGIYSGSLLYKEKLFVEKLFRKGIIKIVVGTDALSLGVNFPAKTVVFAQLSKYFDGPISKREFLQMSGRAGRPNLHDAGYVFWMNTPFESRFQKTGDLYKKLLNKPLEKETLLIQPDYKKIFNEIDFDKLNDKKVIRTVVKKEIDYIKKFLLVDFDPKRYLNQVRKEIKNSIFFIFNNIKNEQDYNLFKNIYFSEFDVELNLSAVKYFIDHGFIDAIDFFVKHSNDSLQKSMLQFLRFYKGIEPICKIKNLLKFIKAIERSDEFVLNPDLITD